MLDAESSTYQNSDIPRKYTCKDKHVLKKNNDLYEGLLSEKKNFVVTTEQCSSAASRFEQWATAIYK